MQFPTFHPDGESLEKYSLGSIGARAAAKIEEHLLVCEVCRQSLQQSDAFADAMKGAAEILRRSPRKTRRRTAAKTSAS